MTNAEAYCILKSAINKAFIEKRAGWPNYKILLDGVSNAASKSPAQALNSVRFSLGGNLATNSSKAYSTVGNFRSMPTKVDTPAATTLSGGGSGSTSVFNVPRTGGTPAPTAGGTPTTTFSTGGSGSTSVLNVPKTGGAPAPKTGGTPTTIPAPTTGGAPAPTTGGAPTTTLSTGSSGSTSVLNFSNTGGMPPASEGLFGKIFLPLAAAGGGAYAGYAGKGAQQSAQDNKAIEDMKQYIAKLEEERKNNYGMLDPNGMDFWDRLAFLFQGNNYKAY